ncbi:hypothetical protein Lesp02_15760 [Lentzea sp. NBRC 105346]|uniref:hypothetical protein n=1 Tax=Lentzea sp. NBRC 105346 TaxID=3032205 RepID=UPI0024A3502F|nr:hypothetical protein [Lentzea sp. NBRC 105346]GLZ29386.1 hypothetical protein Lesp02_15760 [Lentzea sp. NBRC 105346]
MLWEAVVRELTAPAARAECYSAREIYQRVHLLRALRASLPPEEMQAMEAALPRGLLGGFGAFVDSSDAANRRITESHPKRAKLLAKVMDLPFTIHQDLMILSEHDVFKRSISRGFGRAYGPGVNPADRPVIALEVDAAMLLIRFLALLSRASRQKFPTSVLLWLLDLLVSSELASTVTAEPVQNAPPARRVHPPGRLVVAGPRVARAPGRRVPRSSTQRGSRWAVRVRGNALAA